MKTGEENKEEMSMLEDKEEDEGWIEIELMRLMAENEDDRLKAERKHCESDRKELAVMPGKSKDLLRCYSPPVSVNAVFEVQHSQPPDVHIEHVVIKDALWWENRKKNRNALSLLVN